MAGGVIWKVLYGALFVLVLPCLLTLWAKAAEPNVALPAYGSAPLGWLFTIGGLGLMLDAVTDLWRLGGGLPMNAYPPQRLVTQGTFRWVPHPIYAGFAAVCHGVSMASGSSAGLWLVTPAVVLASAALVLGYESVDLRKRCGDTVHILPADQITPLSSEDRIHFFIAVLIPWLALYEFTVNMGVQGVPYRFPFEDRLPVYSWTALIYESTYVTVAIAPWLAQTRRDLRQLMISAWVAMGIVFPFYWILPSAAPRPVIEDTGWLAQLLLWERGNCPPFAAFPSFHVLWTILIARMVLPRWLGVLYATAVAVCCVTTGMHYIPDVLAALAIAPLVLEPRYSWDASRRLTERIANSWLEWRIGSVRLINHGLYAGAAGCVQTLALMAAVGPGGEWKAFTVAIAGLIGAGAWAQWVEGSSRLRRPFGFYGGLIGAVAACLFFDERWTLLAACCLTGPWMQAIGRLRCLVNGCCHGAPAPDGIGIRVTHERSRVTRLAHLANVPIHPTQLYSIACNVMLGLALARLWAYGCPVSLICGLYLLVNGAARFVEEAYRGEPQTSVVLGLRFYQWIAIGSIIAGAVVTSLPAPPPVALHLSSTGLIAALLFGLLAAGAMGVDVPESDRALARLT